MSGPDLTDPRDNPLIPGKPDADPLQDPAQNEMIPQDGSVDEGQYRKSLDHAIGDACTGRPVHRGGDENTAGQRDPLAGLGGDPYAGPSVDQLEGQLATFLKNSNAADYERLKALFRI